MQASYVITLNQFNTGRQDFQKHYCLASYNTNFGGQDFKIDYDDLESEVEDYASNKSIATDDVALRFVHCYDVSNNILYLRFAALCTYSVR